MKTFIEWLLETQLIINNRTKDRQLYRSYGQVSYDKTTKWFVISVRQRQQKEVIAFVERATGNVHLPRTPMEPFPDPVWNVNEPGWKGHAKDIGFK